MKTQRNYLKKGLLSLTFILVSSMLLTSVFAATWSPVVYNLVRAEPSVNDWEIASSIHWQDSTLLPNYERFYWLASTDPPDGFTRWQFRAKMDSWTSWLWAETTKSDMELRMTGPDYYTGNTKTLGVRIELERYWSWFQWHYKYTVYAKNPDGGMDQMLQVDTVGNSEFTIKFVKLTNNPPYDTRLEVYSSATGQTYYHTWLDIWIKNPTGLRCEYHSLKSSTGHAVEAWKDNEVYEYN
jgi:hypothetical protein